VASSANFIMLGCAPNSNRPATNRRAKASFRRMRLKLWKFAANGASTRLRVALSCLGPVSDTTQVSAMALGLNFKDPFKTLV